MSGFTLARTFEAPPDRVWEVVGNVGASPDPRIKVEVEREGSAEGVGTLRLVSLGPLSLREEITSVGPGYAYGYRVLKGVPVRDYTGAVALEERSPGRTDLRWIVRFRPRIPGSGSVISWSTKRLINHLLDAVADRTRSARAEHEGGLSP
jgi:hypothetical protein